MRVLKALAAAAALLAMSLPGVASAQTTVDLSVSIVGRPDPVVSGRAVTWTITVRNLGPGQATGVLLEAVYGSDAFPVSATTTQGTCAPAAGSIDFSLGTISPGGEATATLVMQAFFGDGGFLEVTASSTTNDPNLRDNNASGRVGVISGSNQPNELGGTFCPPSGGVATGGGGTAAGSQPWFPTFALLAAALLAAAVMRVRR